MTKRGAYFLSFAAAAVLLALPLARFSALAATGSCTFGAELEELQKINDPSAELTARKKFFASIVDCGVRDIKNLKANLEGVSLPDTETKNARAQIMGELDEAIGYYNKQNLAVLGAGMRGTKEVARNLLEWRSIYYLPLSQKAITFVMWAKNQNLMQAAEQRLGDIKKTINNLNLSENAELTALAREANGNLENALQANELARRTFLRNYIYEDALALIRTSLEKLSQTYRNFFDLSVAVNKVLPRY